MSTLEQQGERLRQRLEEIRTRRVAQAKTPDDRVRILKISVATLEAHRVILEMFSTAGFSEPAAEACDEFLQALIESHQDTLSAEDISLYLQKKGFGGYPAPHQSLVNKMEHETSNFLQAFRTLVAELLRQGRAYYRQHMANVRHRN